METSKANGIGTRVLDFSKRFLSHRYLPTALAIGAILVMLPALKTGFGGDDRLQRVVELKPSQLPPRMHETGMIGFIKTNRRILKRQNKLALFRGSVNGWVG
jgi:hypothetical protein